LNPRNEPAQNSAEALQRLSEYHRSAFERWKSQLVKSCDGAEAFGMANRGNAADQRGIDLPLFLEKNNHSLVFHGNKGETAVLSGPTAFAGEATSSIEHSETVNGQTYRIQAELLRQGYTCTVFLYGQKVYESSIASGFDIVGYWGSNQSSKLIQAPKVLETHLSNSTGLIEIPEHSIVEAIHGYFQPDAEAIQFISNQLNISENEASQVFHLGAGNLPRNSIRLLRDPNTLWFNSEQKSLIIPVGIISSVFSESMHSTEFEW
jgi:hypothetical protein